MFNKVQMIETLIKNYTCPILISNDTFQGYKNAVEINADCEDEALMCSYNAKGEKEAPVWYQQLMQKGMGKYRLLVIKNLNEVDERKQLRFKEIMKYAQINHMKLPENCVIIVTHSYLKSHRMIEPMMSLCTMVD